MLPPRSGKTRTAVVLLHGYGSDGNDLIALGQMWAPAFPDTVFVSPNAPEACAMNPGGYQWFAWQPPHSIQARAIDPLLAAVEEFYGRS